MISLTGCMTLQGSWLRARLDRGQFSSTHEGKGSSPGKTTGQPAEAHMIIMACTSLLEREPVEIAYRVVVAAAIHDELQGVQTLPKFDGRNLERLPGLPSFGLRN